MTTTLSPAAQHLQAANFTATNPAKTEVFLNVEFVMPRATFPVPSRYKAQWIARGTGTVFYTSKTVDTREQATALARRYLKSTAGARLVDTTRF